MKLPLTAAALTAAVLVGSASAAQPGVARAPGLVVALDGSIYLEGKRVARGDQPAWSLDGRLVAYVRGAAVHLVGEGGRGARRLTAAMGASSPSWSPDGRRIVFSGGRDLYTVSVATRKLARLTRSRPPWLANYTPAWSPDGRTIAFSRSTDAFNNDVFLIRPNGSGLRRLTTTQGTEGRFGEEHGPAWSRDGRTIVFVSNRAGSFDLFSIGRDGSGERRVTSTSGADEDEPAFSPDGTRLVYVRDGRVVVARADGRAPRVLGRGTSADWR